MLQKIQAPFQVKLCRSEIIIHTNYRKQGQNTGFYGYMAASVNTCCSSWHLLMLRKPSITKWSEGKIEVRKSRRGEMPPECFKSHQRVQANPSWLAESTETEIGFVLTSPLLKSVTWQDDRVIKLRRATCKSMVLLCISLSLFGSGQCELNLFKYKNARQVFYYILVQREKTVGVFHL